jgi:NAD(P)H-dependent FMN reductase
MGIRLANYVLEGLRARGDDVELIDAKAIGLPMLDRMYKEYPKGSAPPTMERLAEQIRNADGFIFIPAEYNWGVQPGLKNLTDHFLEEWYWRPAAIASYSGGRLSGAHAATTWHGMLSEMGMVVVSSSLSVGPIFEILIRQGRTDRRKWKATRARFRSLCRRSFVVGRGRQGAEGEEAAAILSRGIGAKRAETGHDSISTGSDPAIRKSRSRPNRSARMRFLRKSTF